MNDAGALSWELPVHRKEGGAAGNRSPALLDRLRPNLKRRL